MGTLQFQVPNDPERVRKAIQEFNEARRYLLESEERATDKAVAFNKDLATFQERLLLVALGIIGLSVTSLVSLIPKITGTPALRATVLHYIVPAWILLLISALSCRHTMVFAIRLNQKILKDWANKLQTFNLQALQRSLKVFEKTLQGNITIESETTSLAELFSKLSDLVQKTINEIGKLPPLEDVAKTETKMVKMYGGISVYALEVALVLLAIAAIRFFSS